MKKKDNQRRWRIELTEEQLRVAIEAIEDWHRFISGQCEMDYATSYIDNSNNMHKVRDILRNQVKPLMFPELDRAASYGWCGGQPNTISTDCCPQEYPIRSSINLQAILSWSPASSTSSERCFAKRQEKVAHRFPTAVKPLRSCRFSKLKTS